MKLRIKYCGGCNPIINRAKVAKEAIDLLREKIEVLVVDNEADVGLIVAGCGVVCIDHAEFEDQAKEWVIVGGDQVDHRTYPAQQLPAVIAQKVLEKYNSLDKG